MEAPRGCSEIWDMIRLMMWIETEKGRRVEVVSLAGGVFPDVVEAEIYVYSGEGGIARLLLQGGGRFPVWRDQVVAICGWEEGIV